MIPSPSGTRRGRPTLRRRLSPENGLRLAGVSRISPGVVTLTTPSVPVPLMVPLPVPTVWLPVAIFVSSANIFNVTYSLAPGVPGPDGRPKLTRVAAISVPVPSPNGKKSVLFCIVLIFPRSRSKTIP